MAQANEPVTIDSQADPGQRDPLDQADFTLDAVSFVTFQALLDQPPAPSDRLRRTLKARAPWGMTAATAEATDPSVK